MEEVWKDVQNYPGYQVSNFGRVMKLKKGVLQEFKPINNGGYILSVFLTKDNYKKLTPLKLIVAKTFLPNVSDYDKIINIDNDIFNNSVTNLLVIPYDDSNLDGEIWVDVDGHDGEYRISNYGRLLSNKQKKRFMKPHNMGYLFTFLYKNNVKKSVIIHRLVAEHFIPNPENKPQVNHKDGNKLNNHVSNLEWATASENIGHAYKNGLKTSKHQRGRDGGINRFYVGKPVLQFDQNHNLLNRYDSISQARIAIGHKSCTGIMNCCKHIGFARKTGGFYWEYEN